MRVAELASGGIGVVYVGKTKAPARGFLGALFFDDQGVGQWGSFAKPYLYTESMRSSRPPFDHCRGGFLWWLLAWLDSIKWIP